MLIFDLTRDRAASDCHFSLQDQGNINWNFSLINHFPKLSLFYQTSNMTIVSSYINCALSIDF